MDYKNRYCPILYVSGDNKHIIIPKANSPEANLRKLFFMTQFLTILSAQYVPIINNGAKLQIKTLSLVDASGIRKVIITTIPIINAVIIVG
jgi:hypothetical protein